MHLIWSLLIVVLTLGGIASLGSEMTASPGETASAADPDVPDPIPPPDR